MAGSGSDICKMLDDFAKDEAEGLRAYSTASFLLRDNEEASDMFFEMSRDEGNHLKALTRLRNKYGCSNRGENG